MMEPMISPAEQGLAKHVCLVIGTLILCGFFAVLVAAMVSSFKGDKDD